MGCTLNKFKTYNVGQVRFDRETGSYTVQLTDRLEKCPDGTFSSRKAKLVVQAGAPPSLAFDTGKNVPVITVPNEGFVINYGDAGFGFGSFLLLALGLGAAYVIVRSLLRKASDSTPTYAAPAAAPAYSQTANAPSAPGYAPQQQPQQSGGTTVVNNNNSGPDLLTTVLVADMLSNHNHTEHTTVIERERVVEREAPSRDDSFSSDSNSNSDDVSSDNDSNSDFSSDSSDSSSDYSSDSSSSSDYSSDSSGGGSDFSSDN